MIFVRFPMRVLFKFEVAWRQLQQMGIPATQYPRCLTIPDFPNSVRRDGYLRFQYDSVLCFTSVSSDESLLCL